MKSLSSILALATMFASVPAYADQTWTFDLSPSSSNSQVSTDPNSPSTGMPLALAGSGMMAVGLAGGIVAMSMPVSPGAQFNRAMGVEIGSDILSLAGITLVVVSLVQMSNYDKWCAKHPVLANVQLAPTNVSYRLTF